MGGRGRIVQNGEEWERILGSRGEQGRTRENRGERGRIGQTRRQYGRIGENSGEQQRIGENEAKQGRIGENRREQGRIGEYRDKQARIGTNGGEQQSKRQQFTAAKTIANGSKQQLITADGNILTSACPYSNRQNHYTIRSLIALSVPPRGQV